MADKKISDLTETTSLADDDEFVVVDTSAGATKRITKANVHDTFNLGMVITPVSSVSPSAYVLDVTGHCFIECLGSVEELTGGVDGQHLYVTGPSSVSAGAWVDAGTAGNAASPNIYLAGGATQRNPYKGDFLHLINDNGEWREVSWHS